MQKALIFLVGVQGDSASFVPSFRQTGNRRVAKDPESPCARLSWPEGAFLTQLATVWEVSRICQ